MLSADATLDEDALRGLLKSGHSRIPVHRPGSRYLTDPLSGMPACITLQLHLLCLTRAAIY